MITNIEDTASDGGGVGAVPDTRPSVVVVIVIVIIAVIVIIIVAQS